jgi:hypothetical protein
MIDLTPAKFGRKVARRIGRPEDMHKRRVVSAICLAHLRAGRCAERKCPASAHSGGGGEQEKCFDSRVRENIYMRECVREMRRRREHGHLFIFTFLRTRSLGLWSEPDLTQTKWLTRRPCLLINLIGSRARID